MLGASTWTVDPLSADLYGFIASLELVVSNPTSG